MLSALNARLGLSLVPERIRLGDGIEVNFDGVDRGSRTFCEIYSRIGVLKGSQPKKVGGDILKMILVERALGGSWTKLICFADEAASRTINGRSWLSLAARTYGIRSEVVALPDEFRKAVLAAQSRQTMVNKV